ncbi:DinB family protein [Paenibacillus humicola]|uniref:DinB family protein n=1 Tax=Paenibacillus humicola TaxID=3110540 RepID=UPI00237BA884|nr:DinB family protein [Paenibacillus humicola]
MEADFNRTWLINKFEEIRQRILQALEQLDDEQVNWQPDPTSHSISTLIRHIDGNIQERILKGILHHDIRRNREKELKQAQAAKSDLETTVRDRLQLVIDTVRDSTDARLVQTQTVRGRERTHLDLLHQCAAHYSEHMGQIFFIAKQILKERYISTSI